MERMSSAHAFDFSLTKQNSSDRNNVISDFGRVTAMLFNAFKIQKISLDEAGSMGPMWAKNLKAVLLNNDDDRSHFLVVPAIFFRPTNNENPKSLPNSSASFSFVCTYIPYPLGL